MLFDLRSLETVRIIEESRVRKRNDHSRTE